MLMLQINMKSISLLVFFLALTTIHAVQPNKWNRNADCINIRNCSAIVSVLRSRPLSAEEMENLRNSLCGYEGNDLKIYCNRITTTTTTTTTTTAEPEIETLDPADVTNHPNLRLLDHQACGPVPQQKVILIGDTQTEIFQYPWMTLIEYNIGRPDTEFFCGGTIIASRYVLTAAYCVVLIPAMIVSTVIGVRVGDHDISKERDCIENKEGVVCAERYQFFGIDKIHAHPQYIAFTSENNIALIRLNGTMDFRSRNIKPICLPLGTAATLIHKRLIVTGWSVSSSHKLLQVKVPLVTNEQCIEKYGQLNINSFYKSMLCTGTQKFGGTCASFEGGALQTAGIYNGESVRIILHAVVNFGLCNRLGNPGVQTNVSYYMKWILDTMTD